MSVSIAQARRPLAMFEYSDDGKHVIAKLMQHGDKFSVTEKIADEWLAHINQESLQGRYDASWVAQFKAEYEAFLKGNELPREGTPIRTWGAITREQGTRLIGMNITTVEDLAAMPDSGLGNLGLDGRYLRDLAKSTLESGVGPAASGQDGRGSGSDHPRAEGADKAHGRTARRP
jgi:hypothetical protein